MHFTLGPIILLKTSARAGVFHKLPYHRANEVRLVNGKYSAAALNL